MWCHRLGNEVTDHAHVEASRVEGRKGKKRKEEMTLYVVGSLSVPAKPQSTFNE